MKLKKYTLSYLFHQAYFSGSIGDAISDFENIIPENSLPNGEDLLSGIGPDKLLSEIFSIVSSNGGDIVSFFLLLLGLGLFSALADSSSSLLGARLYSAVRAGVSAISALFIFSRLSALVFSVSESLGVISGFFSSLIPIITTISLSSGAVTTAGVQAVNMNLTLAVLGKLSSALLAPLVFMIFSLSLTASVGGGGASRLLKGAKSVFLWALGIVTTVLIASISMQSFLATSKDNAALRAAKYALSGSIPIVGSTVSGALSTLLGSLSEVRAVVGVGAVAVIFAVAATPVIIMLLYRLALSVSIWIFDFLGSDGAFGAFSAFRSALDTLISLYAVSAVVYILEIVIFVRGGVNVFV